MSYNNQKPSFSGLFSAAKDMHQAYKQMKQPQSQYGQSYGQGVASAPQSSYEAPQPTVSLDDYPQFTQSIIDAVSSGSKRYFQNMGDSKKYKEIQPILQQIANLPQSILLGQEALPFKPKKGTFYGYKSGGTRRKRKHVKKSRRH